MSKALSHYLDFLRVLAALTVALFHATSWPMTRTTIDFPFGVDAVMVFFVLSGFVIAHVAQTKETTAAAFWAARLSRLWSVLIPALLLTPVFDLIGRQFHPELYEGWGVYLGFDHPVLRLSLAAGFLNEIWFWSVAPLSNGPVWSIAYEFAYYMLFSLAFFLPPRQRPIALAAACLVIGPKILLLMPGWLIGVWIYRNRDRFAFSDPAAAALMLVGPLVVLLGHSRSIFGDDALSPALLIFNLPKVLVSADFHENWLKYSRGFIWLNLVSLVTGLHVIGAISFYRRHPFVEGLSAHLLKGLAALTFSIYLLHHPIQLMLSSMLFDLVQGPPRALLVFAISVVLSAAIGSVLEPLRYRLRAGFHAGRAPTTATPSPAAAGCSGKPMTN
jgi:peptidoglycan/LPS O-acetylase OafA/YrhL